MLIRSAGGRRRTYNPEEGRGRKGPISRKEAMQELIDTVTTSAATRPGYTPWNATLWALCDQGNKEAWFDIPIPAYEWFTEFGLAGITTGDPPDSHAAERMRLLCLSSEQPAVAVLRRFAATGGPLVRRSDLLGSA